MSQGIPMANFILLHGAASTGWLWHRVVPELQQSGHSTAAPDLPAEDPTADLHTYVEVARNAAAKFERQPVTVVAQSMAGFMAPVLATMRAVQRIVLVAPMIPLPHKTGLRWWEATGQPAAQREYLEGLGYSAADANDPEIIFIHDFDDELKAASLAHVTDQQAGPLLTPCPFATWPKVPTHVVAAESDRLFPLDFMVQQSKQRLGITPDVIPGGHMAALSQAGALAELLVRYESSGDPTAA